MGKSKGPRRKSRAMMTKPLRQRGKTGLSKLLIDYQEGEKVVIDIDPSTHDGTPYKRYQGKVAIVTGKRGRAYLLEISYDSKVKKLVALPQHLRKLQ